MAQCELWAGSTLSEERSRKGAAHTLTCGDRARRFAEYLRESRGLAGATVLGHTQQLRAFLLFLRIDQDPGCLRRLALGRIEAFLHCSARTNNRFSLQHIVATVRAYLRLAVRSGEAFSNLASADRYPAGVSLRALAASTCMDSGAGIASFHRSFRAIRTPRLHAVVSGRRLRPAQRGVGTLDPR